MLAFNHSRELFNLEKTVVMLADADGASQSILAQMVSGFGARDLVRCDELVETKRQLAARTLDLIILDPASFGDEGYDLLPWMRRKLQPPRNHVPVLVVTGHTEQCRVDQLRDSGASFIVSKPLSAAVLLDRLLWLSRENRAYIEADTYVGPDRRWHDQPLAPGVVGRRRKDREAMARIAAGGDMNQEDIDMIMAAPVGTGA
jgi:DNA-binding response OmpR family regulator